MIQRIQTLYLLFATVLLAITFFAPLATFSTEAGVTVFRSYELVHPDGVSESTVYIMFLALLAMVVPFGTIFRYKNRMQQIRFGVVEVVLLLGLIVVEAIYCFRFDALFKAAAPQIYSVELKLPLFFPIVALIFVWLAIRAIFRDEMLVRAADRIR